MRCCSNDCVRVLPLLALEFLILTTPLSAGTGRVLTSFLCGREGRREEGRGGEFKNEYL